MTKLINKTMTVAELSEQLINYGYGDIYNYGTIETNLLEENCIAVDEEILISVKIIDIISDYRMAVVKVENIEAM